MYIVILILYYTILTTSKYTDCPPANHGLLAADEIIQPHFSSSLLSSLLPNSLHPLNSYLLLSFLFFLFFCAFLHYFSSLPFTFSATLPLHLPRTASAAAPRYPPLPHLSLESPTRAFYAVLRLSPALSTSSVQPRT